MGQTRVILKDELDWRISAEKLPSMRQGHDLTRDAPAGILALKGFLTKDGLFGLLPIR